MSWIVTYSKSPQIFSKIVKLTYKNYKIFSKNIIKMDTKIDLCDFFLDLPFAVKDLFKNY